MSVDAKLSTLLEVAESLGIEVRHASLEGRGGGLCRIKGKRVLFVDLECDRATRYHAVLHEISQLPEIDDVFLGPELREDIDRYRAEQ
ncbi:MAG: hypothetical protein HOP29_06255 [Phycisphaerales bacterium]|nr:hypothetical protein [Phycisphaerales bacterium]